MGQFVEAEGQIISQTSGRKAAHPSGGTHWRRALTPTIQGPLVGPSHVLRAHGRGPLQHQAHRGPDHSWMIQVTIQPALQACSETGNWFLAGNTVLTEAAYLQHRETSHPSSSGRNGGWDLPAVTFLECVETLWTARDTTQLRYPF